MERATFYLHQILIDFELDYLFTISTSTHCLFSALQSVFILELKCRLRCSVCSTGSQDLLGEQNVCVCACIIQQQQKTKISPEFGGPSEGDPSYQDNHRSRS